LYDRDNQRFTFTDDVYVDLTLGLAFEDLPETARRYISLRSARQFQDRIEGQASQGDSDDERLAFADLSADQLRVERTNALSGNYSTASTLRRTAFGYTPNF
jgi:hypothetical protein